MKSFHQLTNQQLKTTIWKLIQTLHLATIMELIHLCKEMISIRLIVNRKLQLVALSMFEMKKRNLNQKIALNLNNRLVIRNWGFSLIRNPLMPKLESTWLIVTNLSAFKELAPKLNLKSIMKIPRWSIKMTARETCLSRKLIIVKLASNKAPASKNPWILTHTNCKMVQPQTN